MNETSVMQDPIVALCQSDQILEGAREKARNSAEKLGIPTTKHEEWKYSSVAKWIKHPFTQTTGSLVTVASHLEHRGFPSLGGPVLTFVNGQFMASLSDLSGANGKITIQTLAEAREENSEILSSHFGQLSRDEVDYFTAINTAYSQDGVVIRVADRTHLEVPVLIRQITDASQDAVMAQTRHLIVVGEQSEVQLVEHFDAVGENPGFSNACTEIFLGKKSQIQYYKIQEGTDQSYHIGTTEVHQADESYCYSATITLDGQFTRNNLHLAVDGSHIDGFMYGLYIPNKRQHVDNHTLVDHLKPHSQSNELYKGILNDQSTGVFNGKIFVREDAQKTNAYQNCRNVVLSDSATMNTKPQLEIWADDVKCSHGTTTGQLDDEVIFYMQSRGISKAEAIRLQLLAFAGDVISQIKNEALQTYVEERMIQKLS